MIVVLIVAGLVGVGGGGAPGPVRVVRRLLIESHAPMLLRGRFSRPVGS
ncbi:unannotated protein [freshwater metagenome]|uniref:Unannotated protein n=1 Tax=freshwater metagenome TaxID=449393 RepID=A0A6J6EC83_9ZZZZ